MIWNMICMIVFGAIIGMLARLFMSGRQNISMVMTVVLGILGALVGYWIAAAFGVDHTKGIDWIRDIISVVAAIVFISAYLALTGRNNKAVNNY